MVVVTNPIIVALDVPSAAEAVKLARDLAPYIGAVKIGSELFTTAGPEIVRQIRGFGAQVFLDLKYHDIPNTVSKAVTAAVALDVQMVTIHTSGGLEMMRMAEQSTQDAAGRIGRTAPLVLGVTVLTSLENEALSEIGFEPNVGKQVERLANLAVKAGLRGLVCSPLEVTDLRQFLPENFQLVTPGIRPAGSKSDDQKRTLSPSEAMKLGANWIVIGRPIYGASDPVAKAKEIFASLKE
jgi:orotidine-5'-phosphate decarboxylase